MPSRYRNLPLSALRAFEAAARHLSFTKAADELCVTQAAVSRHVRALEGYLGTQLFERGHQKVYLTAGGKRLHDAVALGLAHIATATEDIRQHRQSGKLTVGMPISFASLFMSRRIGDFRSGHPKIDLHLISLERSPVPSTDGFDISVVMDHLPGPGFEADPLFTEEIFPICSANYLGGRARIGTPADLLGETLLHLDDEHWAAYPWPPINWRHWFQKFGVEPASESHGLSFNNYPTMIQTTIRGHGIGLGWRHLVSDYLKEGSLVRPLQETYRVDRRHHLVVPSSSAEREDVAAFCRWFKTQVQDLDPAAHPL